MLRSNFIQDDPAARPYASRLIVTYRTFQQYEKKKSTAGRTLLVSHLSKVVIRRTFSKEIANFVEVTSVPGSTGQKIC